MCPFVSVRPLCPYFSPTDSLGDFQTLCLFLHLSNCSNTKSIFSLFIPLGTKYPWAQNIPGHKISWAQNRFLGHRISFSVTKSLGTESPGHKIVICRHEIPGHRISQAQNWKHNFCGFYWAQNLPRHKMSQAQDCKLGTRCPGHKMS